MASLRLNYDREKRPERGRPINEGIMARRIGFPYPGLFPMPPRPMPVKQFNEVEAVPPPQETSLDLETQQPLATVLPVEDIPWTPQEAVEEIEQTEQSGKTPAEPTLSDSERFITSLESYENGVVRIHQHVDSSKILLDEILYHMDSFLKILDVLKENEERKQNQTQVAVTVQKTSKDTIDEVLELLQTPTFQNILRQVLMGILVKK